MLWVVRPANHSGIGPPPGHVCPPPTTLKRTTAALLVHLEYDRRMTSGATCESDGLNAHPFLRAQFAVQVSWFGNGRSGTTHDVRPVYGVALSAVP